MLPKLSQENIEQERIRQIIYLNLDRLFEELDDLSQQKIEKEASLKEKKGAF